MRYLFRFIIFISALILFSCASDYQIRTINTWKERKDMDVVKQEYDFSCGTGALATLMNYYFGDKVKENDLVKNFLDNLSEDKKNFIKGLKNIKDITEARKAIKENGFSMLELKNISERRGYQAYVINANAKTLQLQIPMLVYLEVRGYKHFAVYCGAREDRIFLADPSRGNVRMSIREFLSEWKGNKALVLVKQEFKKPKNNVLQEKMKGNFMPEIWVARDWLFQN